MTAVLSDAVNTICWIALQTLDIYKRNPIIRYGLVSKRLTGDSQTAFGGVLQHSHVTSLPFTFVDSCARLMDFGMAT